MAEDPAAERTETATPKRREDARKKGDVAQSREVSSVICLAAGLGMLLTWFGVDLGLEVAAQARTLWAEAAAPPSSLADFHALLLHCGVRTLRAAAPFGIVIFAAALAGPLLQVGPLFSGEALAFNGKRINPLSGLKRLVSADRLMELVKSLLKLVVVLTILWVVLRPWLGMVLDLSGAEPAAGLGLARAIAFRFAAAAVLVLAVLAVLDLAWVRWRYEEKLKMTRQQVRDELKQREGSPEVRSRRRSLQRELSRLRMIAATADADVVVRNPTHYAVALRYDRSEMDAPVLLAKGRNRVAQRILDAAREHDVPIVENRPLAQLLYKSGRIGRQIPDSLYQAVAEVLAYVYRLDRGRASAWGAAS